MNPIAERIIDGESVCPIEIYEHNVEFIIRQAKRRKRLGTHDPDNCKIKQCSHNVGNDLDFIDILTEEAKNACECGEH